MRITIARMDDTDYGTDAIVEIEGDDYKLSVLVHDGMTQELSVWDERENYQLVRPTSFA